MGLGLGFCGGGGGGGDGLLLTFLCMGRRVTHSFGGFIDPKALVLFYVSGLSCIFIQSFHLYLLSLFLTCIRICYQILFFFLSFFLSLARLRLLSNIISYCSTYLFLSL